MISTYACQTKLKNPNEGSDTYCYNQQASPTPIDREKERKKYREVKFQLSIIGLLKLVQGFNNLTWEG